MFLIGMMHWQGMTGKVDRKKAFEFFTRSSKVPRLGNEQAVNPMKNTACRASRRM